MVLSTAASPGCAADKYNASEAELENLRLEGEISGVRVHNKPREAQGAARVAVAGEAELMLPSGAGDRSHMMAG
jgi:hypothetical protein